MWVLLAWLGRFKIGYLIFRYMTIFQSNGEAKGNKKETKKPKLREESYSASNRR